MVVLGEGLPLVTSWLGANSITEALATFEIQRLPLASKANPAGLCSEPAFALRGGRAILRRRGDRARFGVVDGEEWQARDQSIHRRIRALRRGLEGGVGADHYHTAP